jgi:hypothetical protein
MRRPVTLIIPRSLSQALTAVLNYHTKLSMQDLVQKNLAALNTLNVSSKRFGQGPVHVVLKIVATADASRFGIVNASATEFIGKIR